MAIVAVAAASLTPLWWPT